LHLDCRSSAWCPSRRQCKSLAVLAERTVSVPGEGVMLRKAAITIPACAIAAIASLYARPSPNTVAATLDLMTQAVIARDAFACQSPWQVIEGRECRGVPAGTEVNIVSGDDFFACVVWPGTQRCMWVARDVLRKP